MKNEAFIAQLSDAGLSQLQGHYTVEKISLEKYDTLLINGMELAVHQYQIKDVGNLLLMQSSNSPAFNLLTFVITPFDKALPLFSCDIVLMNTKRTFLLEYYDLVQKKNSLYLSYIEQFKHLLSKYNTVPDLPAKPCWYDSLKSVSIQKTADETADTILLQLFQENLSEFIEMEYACPPLTEADKKGKWILTKEYADHLLEYGGTSTDLFKSALGLEQTKEFFYSIFFGLRR